jgi:Delta7-sterol 5-desaturase
VLFHVNWLVWINLNNLQSPMDILLTVGWMQSTALLLVFLIVVAATFICLGFLIERMLSNRRIFAIALRPGQRARELRSTVRFQLIAALTFTCFIGADLVTWASGWTAGLTTFLACWIGFEIYYYALHRAMHTRALFRFHREHHQSVINTPLTAFSMSVPESLGWLLGYVFVPLVMALLGLKVSLAGWLAYVVYNYWGNIVGHVNVEVLPRWVGKRVHSWALHAITYHALHHARYTGHYGFGATFMDRWFASEWADWPTLQARVLSGEALTSVKERG